jgi:2',3'-cyclic-nucleotide 2'-phosphodiesterase
MIKILFFGDIVGKIGRRALAKSLPYLKDKYQPDLVIANVENLAHGKGITEKTLIEISDIGVEFFTSGNHIWKREDAQEILSKNKFPLITPLNDPRTINGQGERIVEVAQGKILVVNLLGQVFMKEENLISPFKAMDELLKKYEKEDLLASLVDFHAEATSEKRALGFYLDGRVSAVLGTHTHVATADAQILPQGTGYLTDVGMVGPKQSVLGRCTDKIIEKFLTDGKIPFEIPEEGAVVIDAVYLEINPENKKTVKIERFSEEVTV